MGLFATAIEFYPMHRSGTPLARASASLLGASGAQASRRGGEPVLKISRLGCGQQLDEIIAIKACSLARVRDASFAVTVLPDDVEREMPKGRKILRRVAGAMAGLVLSKCEVEHPVELALNAPVAPYCFTSLLGVSLAIAANLIGGLQRCLAGLEQRGLTYELDYE